MKNDDSRQLSVPRKSEMPAVSALGYPEAVSELESIIAELDRGVVNIDVLSTRFTRAIDIVEELNRRIFKTKADVDALSSRLETVGNPPQSEGS